MAQEIGMTCVTAILLMLVGLRLMCGTCVLLVCACVFVLLVLHGTRTPMGTNAASSAIGISRGTIGMGTVENAVVIQAAEARHGGLGKYDLLVLGLLHG